jgi:3-oxoacyl-[acyl-carrier protein] reductase
MDRKKSKGNTANAIQPGPTITNMNPENADFAAPQRAATALGRHGRPEAVAAD